jgi:uncharacterized linocin/CFP29 family protein
MSNNYLGREDAPLSEKVWNSIDRIVVEIVKSQLSVRRLIRVDGPFGLGFKIVPSVDKILTEESEKSAAMSVSSAVPVVEIQTTFSLGLRDIAASEEHGSPFDTGAIAISAMKLAKKEDELLLNGNKSAGISGLMSMPGVQSQKLKSWEKIGDAADELIKAVTLLDQSGFHGPYSLGLSASLYNQLFRRYSQGNQTEMEHISSFITDGIVKLPALSSGGLLLASGKQFASIMIGQDVSTSFVGPKERSLEFAISETLALRVVQPAAVCVLS